MRRRRSVFSENHLIVDVLKKADRLRERGVARTPMEAFRQMQAKRGNSEKPSGFTLIELMIAVALISILLAAAVPSFRSMIQNNRATARANEFATALSMARSESTRRGFPVRMTSLNGTTPSQWESGWRIWVDSNGNGAYDAGEELQMGSAFLGGATLKNVDGVSEMAFRPDGFVTGIGTSTTFQLRVPDCRGDQGRDIELRSTGRIIANRVTC